MNKIKNIIFDFDGTLADTAPLIVATMQATIEELGLPKRSDAECRATIGVRLEDVPAILWPELPGADGFAPTYRRIFDRLKRPMDVTCFPGVLQALDTLHSEGYGMAIASSRSRASLEEYVAQFGLEDYFAMLVGGNDVTHGKPSPEPVEKILDSYGWQAGETLTVGDAAVDIMMGRGAETLTCAVTYGNGSRGELAEANPTAVIDAFPDLLTLLNK